jgi:hypothetical protein
MDGGILHARSVLIQNSLLKSGESEWSASSTIIWARTRVMINSYVSAGKQRPRRRWHDTESLPNGSIQLPGQ